MDSDTSEIPDYTVRFISYEEDSTLMIVLSHLSEFTITVSLDDLRGSEFEKQYVEFISKFTVNDGVIEPDDSNIEERDQEYAFQDWLLEPCIPLFRQLVPPPNGAITLQELKFPPNRYNLGLVPLNGRLLAQRVSEQEVPTSSATAIPFKYLPNLEPLPRVLASKVLIPPDSRPYNEYTCDDPWKVLIDGEPKILETAIDGGSLEKEISILRRFEETGLGEKIRVPKFHSTVVSDDETQVIGMLLEWMPFGLRTLQDREIRGMRDLHAKWERQVVEMVEQLHAHDIVWEGVCPGKIAIDFDMNAWLMNFSGSFEEGFLDPAVVHTKEGDILGIRKIFHEFLVSENDTELPH